MKNTMKKIYGAILGLVLVPSSLADPLLEDVTLDLIVGGNLGIFGSLVEFNSISGLSAAQVQDIKNTIYDALSATEVANLQQVIGAASLHSDTYRDSLSQTVLSNVSATTAQAVEHAAFDKENVTDHYLLTANMGVAIGLRVAYLGELLQTVPEYTENEFKRQVEYLYHKFNDAGLQTDAYVGLQVNILDRPALFCGEVRFGSNCYDYYVEDKIAGRKHWYRHSLYDIDAYDLAMAKREELREQYKNRFKGSKYGESLSKLAVQAGLSSQ